ncbi:HD domain-containing protein [Actinosynnema sp. NPDC004786]
MRSLTAEARQLARRVLSSELPRRWRHVQGVANRSLMVVPTLSDADADVLLASSLLHDIGYATKLAMTGFHPLDGASYLEAEGFPERVCALVAHHSCAYIEARMRGLSGPLGKWSDERTPVRDALWWADMTTTPDGATIDVHDRINEIQQRYGEGALITIFIRQAQSELVAAVERTEGWLRAAGLGHLAK